MKIISIDLSSNTGVAYFNTEQQDCLIDCFDFTLKRATPMTLNRISKMPLDQLKKKTKRSLKRIADRYDPSNHPNDFMTFVNDYIDELIEEINNRVWFENLDLIVIEQTNKGRDRWKQKLLEWLHYDLCLRLMYRTKVKIAYIDTMEWRKILEIKVSKEEKRENRKIRKHNLEAKETGETLIRGIVKDKDVAIKFCEDTFGLTMKKKDNNVADAICVGYAYLKKIGEI